MYIYITVDIDSLEQSSSHANICFNTVDPFVFFPQNKKENIIWYSPNTACPFLASSDHQIISWRSIMAETFLKQSTAN